MIPKWIYSVSTEQLAKLKTLYQNCKRKLNEDEFDDLFRQYVIGQILSIKTNSTKPWFVIHIKNKNYGVICDVHSNKHTQETRATIEPFFWLEKKQIAKIKKLLKL